jgi:hypothetical protein
MRYQHVVRHLGLLSLLGMALLVGACAMGGTDGNTSAGSTTPPTKIALPANLCDLLTASDLQRITGKTFTAVTGTTDAGSPGGELQRGRCQTDEPGRLALPSQQAGFSIRIFDSPDDALAAFTRLNPPDQGGSPVSGVGDQALGYLPSPDFNLVDLDVVQGAYYLIFLLPPDITIDQCKQVALFVLSHMPRTSGGLTPTAVPATPLPTNTPGRAGPATTWNGTAPGLGTFQLKVSADRSTITELVLNAPSVTCGGSQVSATADIQNSWSISNGQFSMDAAPNPLLDVVIAGQFDASGTHASGTWQGTAFGAHCNGTWTGMPAS